jgi:predicted RNase H-like HicB family nuclease
MSVKSRRSSRKSKTLAPDRPFDPAIWRKAENIAKHYAIVVRAEPEVGGYLGRGIEMPNVMSDGATEEACFASTREALTLAVATLLEERQVPPAPNADERRNEQVNVRLSPFEKTVLEDAARSRGFRGISDFMRAATLASVK